MSVGYEVLILGMVIHGIMAFGVGFMWSLIPRKVVGLLGFMFFYVVIAIWYTATFNFQMLIYSTLYPFYVVVGLVGFALQKHIVYWLVKKGYYKRRMNKQEEDVDS